MEFDNLYLPKDKLSTRYEKAVSKFETLPALQAKFIALPSSVLGTWRAAIMIIKIDWN